MVNLLVLMICKPKTFGVAFGFIVLGDTLIRILAPTPTLLPDPRCAACTHERDAVRCQTKTRSPSRGKYDKEREKE